MEGGPVEQGQGAQYEAIVLVTRGDALPKNNYGTKLHPTYETSIRIKQNLQKLITPHLVVKFFDQYRDLRDELAKLGVGEGKDIPIDAPFPKTHRSSTFGVKMGEDALQERCYVLNKWMQAVFVNYSKFSPAAQKVISDFLSEQDKAGEDNKNLILDMLSKQAEAIKASAAQEQKEPERKEQKSEQKVERAGSVRTQSPAPDTKTAAAAQPTSKPAPAPTPATQSPPKPAPAPAVTSSKSASSSSAQAAKAVQPPAAPVAAPEESARALSAIVEEEDEPVSVPFTTDNLSQHDAGRLDNKSSIRRGNSVDSAITMMYTGAQLAEYAKETIVVPFMAVSVLRGEMIPKHADDSRLHHSYETLIRVLPLQDIQYENKDAIDAEVYAQHSNLPPISVANVFDGYRQLKLDLEECGVFSKDAQKEATKFNENERVRRHAIVINVSFPKTLRRSSIGLSLTDQQLQMRVVQLNQWMGELIKACHTLPRDAQDKIMGFLSLPTSTTVAAPADDLQDHVRQDEIFTAMLRGKYTPPMKPVVAEKRKSQEFSLRGALMGKSNSTSDRPASTAVPAVPSSGSSYAAPAPQPAAPSAASSAAPSASPASPASTAASSPPRPHYDEQDRQPSEASMATVASRVLSPAQLAEYSRETIINSYLGVLVSGGAKVAKTSSGQAKHPGYTITLRALPYEELVNKDIDATAYTQTVSSGGKIHAVQVTKAFDAYRALKTLLEGHGVACHDDRRTNGQIIVEASFPKTYKRSSFGVGLTEAQQRMRSAELNRYMGALLSKYHLYKLDAQEDINHFLQLDEDNPTDPMGRQIVAMLNRKYQPAGIKQASITASNRDSTKKKEKKAHFKDAHAGKYDPTDDFAEDEDQPEGVEVVGSGKGGGCGACVIM